MKCEQQIESEKIKTSIFVFIKIHTNENYRRF